MNEYVEVGIRSVLVFAGLLILALMMGRKQLSQITFFDYIVGITIGSIAAVLVVDRSINVIDGIIALVLWAVLPLIVGYASMKSIRFRQLVDGEPKVVIQNGVIINKNMMKERYNMGDLMMQLRDKGVFDISEVEFAVLEPNGDLSVLKKSLYNPLTPNDVNIEINNKGIMIDLIIDGRIITKHLLNIDKDTNWLKEQLAKMRIEDIEEVVFAGYQSNGQLYVSLRNDLKGIDLI